MPDTRQRLRERHVKNPYSDHCLWDSEVWPCDASRLLAHIDALTAAVEGLPTLTAEDVRWKGGRPVSVSAVLAILGGSE